MISFVWPWIFLLAPVPLLLWKHLFNANNTDGAIKIPPSAASALRRVAKHGKARLHTRTLNMLLLAGAWLALLTAIAQPYKPESVSALPASGRALTLLVDLSTSMERKDFIMDGEAVDRLTVVKKVAGQFLDNRSGDRIGLVLFGSEAFIAAPLTFDLNSIDTILNNSGIGMAGRTTAIGDALGLAIVLLRDDPADRKSIVLLSDGTNNTGTVEPEDAAQLAKSLGVNIYSIGLGSDNATETQLFQSPSADLDEATLKAIAETSGGRFFRAHTTAELERIYHQIDTIELSKSTAPPIIFKRDYRNVFILLSLFFLAPSLLRDSTSRYSAERHTA